MAERRSRPGVKEIKDAYDYLFSSSATLSKIKDATLGGRLFSSPDEDAAGIVGRSLTWKLFLVESEPLHSESAEGIASCPINSLRAFRQEFQKLLLDKMRAPDGSYEEGLIIPGTDVSPPRVERSSANLDQNNPLSLHDENPWTAWFASMDLRKTILQDVERTFPDIGYFRDPEVQTQLTNVLFVYSTTHPDIGYRQGMHELLAPLYYAVDFDSIPEGASSIDDVSLKECCSRVWVAADAWALFSMVMRGVGHWYEWRETKLPVAGKTALASHVQLNVTPVDVGLKPYIAPIVEACNRIQSTLLKSVDPQLWRSLQSSGIEPQIYGIRWLRLLFTREFIMDDAMRLWDGLFACDPSFELAPWICVAMLIRIRNKLIPADYSTQLTYLLRYPASPFPDENPNFKPSIPHTALLLRQALTLQMSPTSATGASIVHENHNLLNIPTEVPDPPPPPARRRAQTAHKGQSSYDGVPSAAHGSNKTHIRQGSTPMGLPEMIARGLLERSESLGINKTVMNAVSELKRNLPDLATSLTRIPMTPGPTTSYAAYPLVDERPPAERPPWEPRTRFEMERDISELRSVQRRLGDSVGWIVDTLLLSEDDDQRASSIRERKREAVESLSYVRDILKGTVPSSEIEDGRLLAEEHKARRNKEKEAVEVNNRTRETPIQGPSRISSGPSPPPPIAAVLPQFQAHSQASVVRSTQDYLSSVPSLTRATPSSSAASPVQIVTRQKTSSPTPSVSVLTPNNNSMPLAPWAYTRSSFATRESPIATLPRIPSKPPVVASVRHGTPRLTPSYVLPQTPPKEVPSRDQPPPKGTQQFDPLGVLR